MKKLLTIICLSFIFGAGSVFADESASIETPTTYGVKYNSQTQKNEIWLASDDGTETFLIDFRFPSNAWTPANSFSDVKTGKLYLWAASGQVCATEGGCLEEDGTPKLGAQYRDMTDEEKGFVVYDPSSNTIEMGVKKGYIDGYQKTFQSVLKLDEIIKNDVDSDDGSDTTVIGSTEIVGSDGDTLISKESDGSVHIGENSLVTVEENGVQQLYATNANDEMININIKKGTDLLIDGVSVAGSLDKNATDIATNKTSIATNATNIAANTAEIATYTDSIAGNTTAIAALGSDLNAHKASTNSQLNYMKSDYSSGIASAVAMSQFNLAQEGFSIGIGRGSYNDENETAFGLGYGGEFKNGTLFKLQASKSGDASGVGLTISF